MTSQKFGIRFRLLNNYDADLCLVPGEINKRYLVWRGVPESRCRIVGLVPPRAKKSGLNPATRVIVSSQNWRGHGFIRYADEQKNILPLVCRELRERLRVCVILRAHPRDHDEYEGVEIDRHPDFIDSVSSRDILVTSLSSLATDCRALGAKVVFFVPPISLEVVHEVMNENSVPYETTVDGVIMEVERILHGHVPAAEAFLDLTSSNNPAPISKYAAADFKK